jgi:hypothetical protein
MSNNYYQQKFFENLIFPKKSKSTKDTNYVEFLEKENMKKECG